MNADKNLFSINLLAEEFQIDRRTVSKRLESLKPQKIERNAKLYRLRDAVPLLALDLIDDLPSGGDTYQDAKRRRELALAKLVEIELAEKQGRTADVTKIAEQWALIGNNMRTRLLAIPTRAAPLVAACKTPAEAYAVINDLIYEALTELSGDAPGTSNTAQS